MAGLDLDAAPARWPDYFAGWRLHDVREVILHVIAETAVHAGHLDTARELIDGRTWLGPDDSRLPRDLAGAPGTEAGDSMTNWEKEIGAMTLFVPDLDRARRFYQDVFGLRAQATDEDAAMVRFKEHVRLLAQGAGRATHRR